VYDTWVEYEVDRWVQLNRFPGSGLDDEPRVIPGANLGVGTYPRRLTAPSFICSAIGKSLKTQKLRTFSLPCDQYDRLDVHDRIVLKSALFGLIIWVDDN
jgi:hypothetical protein